MNDFNVVSTEISSEFSTKWIMNNPDLASARMTEFIQTHQDQFSIKVECKAGRLVFTATRE